MQTKRDLDKQVALILGLRLEEIEDITDVFVHVLTQQLLQGTVYLPELGHLHIHRPHKNNGLRMIWKPAVSARVLHKEINTDDDGKV